MLQEIASHSVYFVLIVAQTANILFSLCIVVNSSYEAFAKKKFWVVSLSIKGINIERGIILNIPVLCKHLPELIHVFKRFLLLILVDS